VSDYDQNKNTWDRLAREEYPLARPAGEKEFQNPDFITNPWGWIGPDVKGKKVLCLAAGGGKHSILFARAGADTSVIDISPAMLELDRKLAREHDQQIRVVEGSMDNLGMFDQAEFDIVIQPVSTCYIPDITAVYREVARVCKPGGIYISQHKQPHSLAAGIRPIGVGYVVIEPYYRSGPLPEVSGVNPVREAGAREFLHRWDEILGSLCKTGFSIEDVNEPRHGEPNSPTGTFKHRSNYLPPYIALKARRRADHDPSKQTIILPS
jgi:SAM-dependent methyltransferase